MTTICIIADTHRRHRELVIPPCDLLIHCGDICSFQQDDMGTLEDIDCWFGEVPARRVVCIGGNHDFELQSCGFRFAHAEYLCDRQTPHASSAVSETPLQTNFPDGAAEYNFLTAASLQK